MKGPRPTGADTIVGTRSAADNHCWLCGAPGRPERTLRADIHMSGHLCLSCWALQPRGRSAWSRAASALYAALQLPREWHTGYRSGWLEAAALHHGITAWYDAPRGTALPAEPFGWIPREVLEAAAAELQDQEDAFQRSRIPPAHRQATR
ncbi:hypothetical protein [Streptomyces pseudogriseolus]|uniref:hypothetical protein n=1 Tax=Streptomyces pseudogriseolus TaxID=36817 RepID=UPI003FA26ED1